MSAAVIIAAVIGGIGLKTTLDAQAAQQAAQEAEEKAEAEAAAEKRRDDAERAERAATILQIEASVQQMAEKHASDGIIDGPIIAVKCSPVGGGSTDDLTERTTVFACFVGNVDNGDGTMSGYNYHATMNWDTGEYTYGLGKP